VARAREPFGRIVNCHHLAIEATEALISVYTWQTIEAINLGIRVRNRRIVVGERDIDTWSYLAFNMYLFLYMLHCILSISEQWKKTHSPSKGKFLFSYCLKCM
jgi:hypothetical protein